MQQAIVNEKLPIIKSDIEGIVKEVSVIIVNDEESRSAASEVMKKIRSREKRIDDLRKEIIKPYQDQVKTYNAAFNNELDKLVRARKLIEQKLEAYMQFLEKKAAEEQARIEAKKREAEEKARKEAEELKKQAAEAKNVEQKEFLEEQAEKKVFEAQIAHMPAEQVQNTIRTDTGTVTRKKVWDFQITDEQEFIKHFPELCSPDTTKIREYIQAQKEETEIHGLKVFQKAVYSSR